MGSHRLDAKFGPVVVKVHRCACDGGWRPVVVGQHSLPAVPRLAGCAPSEADALERLAAVIERMELD